MLRIHPEDDGTYTVPAGNLFPAGTAQTRPEIYAMGFRNPFRIGIDPATDTLYVADYGPGRRRGQPQPGPARARSSGTSSAQPGNYGWPYCHGNNYAYNDFTFPSGPSGPKFNCAAPVNNSPNNTGLTTLPPAIGGHRRLRLQRQPALPGDRRRRRADGRPGLPLSTPRSTSDRKWPAYYDGKAMFGEWNQNKLYTFQVDRRRPHPGRHQPAAGRR